MQLTSALLQEHMELNEHGLSCGEALSVITRSRMMMAIIWVDFDRECSIIWDEKLPGERSHLCCGWNQEGASTDREDAIIWDGWRLWTIVFD